MSESVFSIFPNENFVDLSLYQYGMEQCPPAYSFGPATRNHYLFHYVLSGTGRLIANDSKGISHEYQIRSGEGFMIFPRQINTYIADPKLLLPIRNCPGSIYGSNSTVCARVRSSRRPDCRPTIRSIMPLTKTSAKI